MDGRFEQMYMLLREVAYNIIPHRLLTAMALHVKLLNPFLIHGGERASVIHVLGYLLADASEYGVEAYLSLRDKIVARRGLDAFYEFMVSARESAYMLFYLSLNAEPFKRHRFLVERGLGLRDIVSDACVMASRIEATMPRLEGSGDTEYVRLHLARTYAELARLTYSVAEARGIVSRRLCGGVSGEAGPVLECVLEKARRLVYGAETDVPMLALIQVASTETRSRGVMPENTWRLVEGELAEARRVLDEASIGMLWEYDGLSLPGSYYYNRGWLLAHRSYSEAAESFWRAAENFLRIKLGGEEALLGFVRGAYVSLWNYYLMRISHHVSRGEPPPQDLIDEAVEWGRLVEKAYTEPGEEGRLFLRLRGKMGIHGWYSHLMAMVLCLVYGCSRRPSPGMLDMYPGRIRGLYMFAKNIVSGNIYEAVKYMDVLGARPRSIIEAFYREGSGPGRSLAYSMTIREKPIIERLISCSEEGRVNEARRYAALLALYSA